MRPSCAFVPRPRGASVFLCGLALGVAAGCHRGAAAPAPAPAHERVNVGYGTRSREQTGGAVQSATAQELRNVRPARVEELIDGRFPGVHVLRTAGGGVSIRIRGADGLSPAREPLYVVDGMPVEVVPGRGLDWLNPADVARIDVLRNAAETTMFGARGANGVVLITTKRPR